MIGSDGGFDYEANLAACAAGSRGALRTLYEREARWLLGVAMRIVRNRALAEEVLQEAFLQIWRGARTFDRSRGSGRGWIYTVVRHRALQEIRKAVPTDGAEPLDVENLPGEEPVADESLQGIDAEDLDRCLEQLEPQRRECITQAFVEGYSHAQIAARIGKPVGTVKSWVRRGLLSLKDCLS
jgi:RNA polymerase sigma-70 factor, ECF subfamily